jgi:c-di-GMP-binding flagellar brake protein YcgR
MSTWDGSIDRRKHRRAAIRIRSEFGDATSPTWIETVDFSAGGFSCWTNHAIQPLTRLALCFEFPAFGEDPAREIRCEAVVVRCEKKKEPPKTWIIAAAFTGIDPESRSHITRFVQWHEAVMQPRGEDEDCIDDLAGSPDARG